MAARTPPTPPPTTRTLRGDAPSTRSDARSNYYSNHFQEPHSWPIARWAIWIELPIKGMAPAGRATVQEVTLEMGCCSSKLTHHGRRSANTTGQGWRAGLDQVRAAVGAPSPVVLCDLTAPWADRAPPGRRGGLTPIHQRQTEGERRARAQPALRPDLSAMGLGD